MCVCGRVWVCAFHVFALVCVCDCLCRVRLGVRMFISALLLVLCPHVSCVYAFLSYISLSVCMCLWNAYVFFCVRCLECYVVSVSCGSYVCVCVCSSFPCVSDVFSLQPIVRTKHWLFCTRARPLSRCWVPCQRALSACQHSDLHRIWVTHFFSDNPLTLCVETFKVVRTHCIHCFHSSISRVMSVQHTYHTQDPFTQAQAPRFARILTHTLIARIDANNNE